MKITAETRSDQLNADDLIGGPATYTIKAIHPGKAEQKYDIELAEVEGRAWRPPKTVRAILIEAWGDDAANWIGQRVTLFRDETVKFGGQIDPGIRVSHATGLPGNKPFTTTPILVSRGKRRPFTIQPLVESTPTTPDLTPRIEQAVTAFSGIGVTVEQITAKLGGRATDDWTAADLDELVRVYQSISGGETTVADEFGGEVA